VEALLDECRRTPRLFVATLRQALLRYPEQLRAFADLRKGLQRGVRDVASPRLVEWKRRVGEHHLLDDKGPSKFAQLISANDEQPQSVLHDAGLDDELAGGEFVRLAMREFLSELEEDLKAEPDRLDLSHRLEFVATERSLRFPSDAHLAANALLRPFVNQQPVAEVRSQIEAFLIKHVKDPRFEKANWQRVESAAKAVFLRWILGATLEDFFRLISKNAIEKHWRYRRAFWRAYFKKDLISDAWVVLGEEARRIARTAWRDVPPYAILYGTQDRSHSVLLLRIGSLTVAEWSHNGKCRIWRDGSDTVPKFYERLYLRDQLRDGADAEIVPTWSEHYTWQGKLANIIRRETGCDVRQADYRVR
jgi:hypothetical protein